MHVYSISHFFFKVDVVNRYIQPISGSSKKSPFYSLSCFEGCSWWHQCFLNKYAQPSFATKGNITGRSPITIITRVSWCAQESWGSIERWHDVMSWWIQPDTTGGLSSYFRETNIRERGRRSNLYMNAAADLPNIWLEIVSRLINYWIYSYTYARGQRKYIYRVYDELKLLDISNWLCSALWFYFH